MKVWSIFNWLRTGFSSGFL